MITKAVSKDKTKFLLKENNLVKVKYIYSTNNEDFEYFKNFERAAEANNWTKNIG
ncbi:5014_t:CDS:1 [Gigaspora margarita]|uniref:5014_t:CDS:1 n=1 Tax=Gigaspora margarita TaxID=4874 RepID=A0ABN7VXK0_GIGMA|nr:5014_t:CDS:1 [Gigaspora margarita]